MLSTTCRFVPPSEKRADLSSQDVAGVVSSSGLAVVPDFVSEDFVLEGSKDLLYFPVRGEPRIVSLGRLALKELNYSPYLKSRTRGKNGRGLLRRTFMVTDPREPYMLIYIVQAAKNRFPVNMYLTEKLEAVSGGLRRPWIGPVLVEYERDGVLNAEVLAEEVESVVEHVHSVYERFHPDQSILFDSLPMDPSIRVYSNSDFGMLGFGDEGALSGASGSAD